VSTFQHFVSVQFRAELRSALSHCFEWKQLLFFDEEVQNDFDARWLPPALCSHVIGDSLLAPYENKKSDQILCRSSGAAEGSSTTTTSSPGKVSGRSRKFSY